MIGAQGAVKNVAWLQGNQLSDGSSDLDVSTATALTWNQKSVIDPKVYDHLFTNGHILTVLKDGDYFVAATLPITGPGARITQRIEIYVNGLETGHVGQSTYIRNANGHSESSAHVHTLLPGLSAGDVIEVRTERIIVAGVSVADTASLYVELIPEEDSIFLARSSGTTEGTNVNPPDITELVWNSKISDAGFTHSDGGSDIVLDDPGDYMVYVNIPLNGTPARSSVQLIVYLDQFEIEGGFAQQGYIRNASGHFDASIHWSGIVRTETVSQVLSIGVNAQGNAGTVTMGGREASISLQKIDTSSGVFSAVSIDMADETFNYNSDDKSSLAWVSGSPLPIILDDATFAHDELGVDRQNIQVEKAGSYLLVYNDVLQGDAARVNPRITVEVNGDPVPGLETKSHYIRISNGHNASSGTIVGLLDGLAENDVITISSQREAAGGQAENLSPALLTLIAKEFTPGRTAITGISGDISGFEISVIEEGPAVNRESVSVTLNGNPVEVTFTATDGHLIISHEFDTSPTPDSDQVVTVSFTDSGDPAGTHKADLSYVMDTQYSVVPANYATEGVNTDAPGFVANVTQVTIEQSDVTSLHGNDINQAEIQLRGGFGIDELTGETFYFNEAGPEDAIVWEILSRDVEGVINWDQLGGGALGNFADDELIPGIPGFFGVNDGIVAEMLTWLQLDAGFHTFGVNSDDGFKVTTGPSARGPGAQILGKFNGGRGADDTLFNFVVEEAGIYPFRLLWFVGTGGGNVEFFSVVDDEKILINDPDNDKAVKAYREGPLLPYIESFSPELYMIADRIDAVLLDDEFAVMPGTVKLSVDGQNVTPVTVTHGDGVTTLGYDNGGLFSSGFHVATVTFLANTVPPATVVYNVDFGVKDDSTWEEDFAVDPGWSGENNNDGVDGYTFSNSGNVGLGVGEVGGLFDRGNPYSYFVDANRDYNFGPDDVIGGAGTFIIIFEDGHVGNDDMFIGHISSSGGNQPGFMVGAIIRESDKGTTGFRFRFRAGSTDVASGSFGGCCPGAGGYADVSIGDAHTFEYHWRPNGDFIGTLDGVEVASTNVPRPDAADIAGFGLGGRHRVDDPTLQGYNVFLDDVVYSYVAPELTFGDTIVEENFAVDPGWTGENNDDGVDGYTFSDTANVGFEAGEVGGFFDRGNLYSYYADTTLAYNFGPEDVIEAAGSFIIILEEGHDANDDVFIGHISSSGGKQPDFLAGVIIREPSNDTTGFRLRFRAGGANVPSGPFDDNSVISVGVVHSFEYHWRPNGDFIGKLDGGEVANANVPRPATPDIAGFGLGGRHRVDDPTLQGYNVFLDDVVYSYTEGEAPAAKPTIGVVRNADGTVTVTYTGKLQVAPTVNGPWEDVEGATSPLTLQPDQPATFGRTVSE
jgi:hypothetical protein